MMYAKKVRIVGIIFIFFSYSFAAQCQEKVVLGLERLTQEFPQKFSGKKIGIIANHTAVDSSGNSIVSLLAPQAKIVALFGPEHGFAGDQSAGADIQKSVLQGIPIYSLYGDYRTPTKNMVKGVDLLIYDMQDTGTRFYTYISSLYLALTAARRQGIPILVLDRPNPITAARVEGAALNPAFASFVGVMPLTIRYGMTVGELVQLMNAESYAGFSIGADLAVVPMKNYRRTMWYDETGLPWIPPSPNMPALETAVFYPGFCLFEGTNLSEGRGTEAPFQTIGAPFIDSEQWLKAVPKEVREGAQITELRFTPKSIPGKAENPKYKDKPCNGLQFKVTDRSALKPIDLAVALLCVAQSLYPKQFKLTQTLDRLWGDETLRSQIEEGAGYSEILAAERRGIDSFLSVRKKYLLYSD